MALLILKEMVMLLKVVLEKAKANTKAMYLKRPECIVFPERYGVFLQVNSDQFWGSE